MAISRRTFLIGLTTSALVLPELVAPRRTFFLPPSGGWLTGPQLIQYGDLSTEIWEDVRTGEPVHIRMARQYTIVNESSEDLTDWAHFAIAAP